MKSFYFYIACLIVLNITFACSQSIDPINAVDDNKPGYTEPVVYSEYVQRQPWIVSDHTVAGWDWSLPDWVTPSANSGEVSDLKVRPGDKLPWIAAKSVVFSWRQLEPVEGKYNFTALINELNTLDAAGKKAEIHLTYCTDTTEYFVKWPDGKLIPNPSKGEKGTAPRWLKDKYNLKVYPEPIVTNITTPFRLVNFDIYDPIFFDRLMLLISELGKQNVLSHKAILCIYLHERSTTRGEEGAGPNSGEAQQKFFAKLAAWKKASGNNIHKMMYLGFSGENFTQAINSGMGQRNGFIEMYLRHVGNPYMGLSVDAEGYMHVDDNYPPIAQGRAWGDENEEYDANISQPRFGDVSTFPHRYKEASLMLLVMRRTTIWEQTGGKTLNPHLTAYVGLELGRNVKTTPDVWCYLRENKILKWDDDKIQYTYKNFERWMWQRDERNAKTVATRKVAHGIQMKIAPGYNYDLTARRGNKIGFYIDPKFFDGYSGKFAIKVTYYDNADFDICYNTKNGLEKKSIKTTNTDNFQTTTFIVDNIVKNNGLFDLFLQASSGQQVEASMVRIVKVNPN